MIIIKYSKTLVSNVHNHVKMISFRHHHFNYHFNHHFNNNLIGKSVTILEFQKRHSLLMNVSLNGILNRYFWGKGTLKPGEVSPGVKAKDVAKAEKSFKDIPDRDKQKFLAIIDNAKTEKLIKRQGYVEFITAAMTHMKAYGVHKDLETYKALMNTFPKDGRFKPETMIQAGFGHYFLQQRCAITLLDEMEYNHVMPDAEMEKLIVELFSKHSYVWRKCARMNYWMAKIKNLDPFPIPADDLPHDALELAILAMKRMCVDIQTKISVYSSAQVNDSIDKTWIVSAQSPAQRELIAELPFQETVYVEGPFRVWLRNESISYFHLRANVDLSKQKIIDDDEINDVSQIPLNTFGGKTKEETLSPQKNLHIQDDGKFLGLCATGTSSRDSLLSWIRILQSLNINLKNLRIIFTLKAPSTDIQTVNEPKNEESESVMSNK